MSAFTDLVAELHDGEIVEAIVFGDWGWSGWEEPDPPPVPENIRGKVLTLEQAEPYMRSWSFDGGYGSPECYAVHIWTTRRVLWVTQYDGATQLDSAPRHPTDCKPIMPGG